MVSLNKMICKINDFFCSLGKIRGIRAWTGKKYIFSQTLSANEFMDKGKIIVQHLLEYQENRFLLGSFSLDINSQNLFGILQGEMLHDPYDHFTLTSSSYKKFKKIAKQKKASIGSIELND